MAVSEDTNAMVAAQLTVAWSNMFATTPGSGGLSRAQMQDNIVGAYEMFGTLLANGKIKHPAPPQT